MKQLWTTLLVLAGLITSYAEERPNFVLLIADDISYDDLGCYGSVDARTPHIDSLAQEGMLFTNAFLTASSCSPSRSSIITGRYPHNNGEAAELHRPISAHLPSFPGKLRESGYYTALAGKDHMTWQEGDGSEEIPTEPFDKKYGPKIPGNSGGHGNWIKALEDCPDDRPFFLWLAALDAHRVWDGKHEWDESLYGPKYDPDSLTLPPAFVDTPETRADFAAYLLEVTRFDYFVGEVVKKLKADGLFENTYLYVLADNGRPFPRAKTRLIDDGMKTYFVSSGPAIATPGATSHSLVSVIDIAPTILELAGVESPETFQARSFTRLYANPESTIRPFVFSEHNCHDYEAHGRSIRGANGWLYIRNFRPALALQGPADSCKSDTFQDLLAASKSSEPLTPAQADVFLAPRAEVELYDTRSDPHQISNLAGVPDYAGIEKNLAEQLEKWMKETGDSVPEEISQDYFSRTTGDRLPIKKEDFQRPPPGADRKADRINSEGL